MNTHHRLQHRTNAQQVMGLSDDIKWYHLLGAYMVFMGYEVWKWSKRTGLQCYDLVCDGVDTVSENISKSTNEALYITGLKKSGGPRRFRRFFELPAEIRGMIWGEWIRELGARVIEIRQEGYDEELRSPCRIPALLHTCRESRAEALKVYQLTFGLSGVGNGDWELRNGSGRGRIYVDFERDIIFFGRRCDFYAIQELGVDAIPRVYGLSNIQHLALRSKYYDDVNRFSMLCFKELNEVILVAQRMDERRFEIGRSPTLQVVSGARELGFEVARVLWNHTIDLARKIAEWRNGGGGGLVEVRAGKLEKGRGDRWFCKGRVFNF